MFFADLVRGLNRGINETGRNRPRPVAVRRRLTLELLEDRCAPAILTVNTVTDPANPPTSGSFLSLREAIAAVNSEDNGTVIPAVELGQIAGTLGQNDTIVFDSTVFAQGGTINLTASLPALNLPVQILGPGANQLTINGGGQFGLFSIPFGELTISGLTLANGSSGYGGTIESTRPNGSILTVNDCTFFDNVASNAGGAIFASAGLVTVTQCTFTHNQSQLPGSAGGAIATTAINGSLNVIGGSFTGNSASGGGGAIAYGGQTTVQNSVFTGNTAISGGAIEGIDQGFARGATPAGLAATDDTFSGNQATNGGAIYAGNYVNIASCAFLGNGASLSVSAEGGAIDTSAVISAVIVDSTFAGNGSVGFGGALYISADLASSGATVTLTNDTIAGNSVDTSGGGGGIYVQSGANVALYNSIVAGNTELGYSSDISGTVTTAGNDIIDSAGSDDGGIGTYTTGSDIGVAPALLPLGNYGGPTQTMLPVMSSPAIGGGNISWDGWSTDQRGFSYDGAPGVGAVDAQPAGTPTHLELQGPTTAALGSTMSWTATVLDDNNVPVTNFAGPVLISVVSGPGNFTDSSTTTASVLYGNATFNNLALDMPGYYTIQASFGNNTITAPLVVTGGQLTFAKQPTATVTAGNSIGTIQVDISNSGQPISGADGPVTLTLINLTQPNEPAIFSSNGQSTATLSALNGVATFTGLVMDAPGKYELQASAGDLSATSATFTVNPAAAYQLAFVQQPTAVTAGQKIAPAVTVQVEDQFGNVVTTTGTITLAAQGPGSFTAGTTTKASLPAGGAPAIFSNLVLTTTGSYTLKATDGSLLAATSTSFNVNPVDPVVGPSQNAVVNKVYATKLYAKVTDTLGKPIPGVRVTFTAPAAGPSGTFAGRVTVAVVTNASGLAVAPAFRANTKAGTFTVTVAFSGAAPAETIQMTNLAGPPARLTALPYAQGAAVPNGLLVSPQVQVTDAFGNLLSGVLVTFTVHANTATGAGAVFDQNQASVAVTSSLKGIAVAPSLHANKNAGVFTITAAVLGITEEVLFKITT